MTRRGNVEKIILDFAKAVCEGERTMIDEKKVELMKKLQRLAERKKRRDSEKQKTVHSGKTDTRRKTHEYTRCKKNI